MMLLETKVEPGNFIAERAVSAQVSCSDLKRCHKSCSAPRTTERKEQLYYTRTAGPTSEQARCLKLLNQSTWARQWSKAWMSSCVTTRFIWDCWWMLFWHKTIYKHEGTWSIPDAAKCLKPQEVPTCEEAASKPPLTVPSQFSQVKCRSFNTLLHRGEGKDFNVSIVQHYTK